MIFSDFSFLFPAGRSLIVNVAEDFSILRPHQVAVLTLSHEASGTHSGLQLILQQLGYTVNDHTQAIGNWESLDSLQTDL